MGCKRGFTLIEALTAAGLTLLLFSLTVSYLVPMLHLQLRSQRQADLDRHLSLAMHRLQDDLERTNRTGICLSSDASTLALRPLAGVTPDGLLFYAPVLVLYSLNREKGQLIRTEWSQDPALLPAERALHLDDKQLASMATLADAPRRVLAAGVQSFEVQLGASQTLQVSLLLQNQAGRRQSTQMLYWRTP